MAKVKKPIHPPKATAEEQAYVRAMQKNSALDLLEAGNAKVIKRADYPLPLKRFIERERTMVHVKLSPAMRRKLEQRSQKSGLRPDELVQQWIRAKLERDAG